MINSQLPVVIIGAGGHAKVVVDTLQAMRCEILGYTNITNNKPLLLIEWFSLLNTIFNSLSKKSVFCNPKG